MRSCSSVVRVEIGLRIEVETVAETETSEIATVVMNEPETQTENPAATVIEVAVSTGDLSQSHVNETVIVNESALRPKDR
jgi:hypothetical protein